MADLLIAGHGGDPLASHRRDVTVIFADLRGFTSFAEAAEPEEVIAVLREYHATIGELVLHYEGTLERFVGDGVLVLFNDPLPQEDHTERAVRMALEMRERVHVLSEHWSRRGHALGFGIGVACGYATLGSVGFERRLEYSVIGPVPDLACRLCDEARPGQILISQLVSASLPDHYETAALGELALKGFPNRVPVFELARPQGYHSCNRSR